LNSHNQLIGCLGEQELNLKLGLIPARKLAPETDSDVKLSNMWYVCQLSL